MSLNLVTSYPTIVAVSNQKGTNPGRPPCNRLADCCCTRVGYSPKSTISVEKKIPNSSSRVMENQEAGMSREGMETRSNARHPNQRGPTIRWHDDTEELDTALVIIVEMTDREWVARFAEAIRVSPPRDKGQVILLPNRRPKFRRGASGLRALRILVEVMPYLYGQKLLEAKRAVEYFSPTGYTEGCHKAAEIWGGIR